MPAVTVCDGTISRSLQRGLISMTTTPKSLSPVKRLVISEILIVLILSFSFLAYKRLEAQKPTVQEKAAESSRLNVDVYSVESMNFQELLSGFGDCSRGP